MEPYIMNKLKKIIEKLKTEQPDKYSKPVRFYLHYILNQCSDCGNTSFREAINVFWKEELYDKSINYFISIIKNKHQDYIKKKARESRSLGSLPENNK